MEFPPGWNGMARTPPLGWRSWNAFGNRISQSLIMEQIDAIVAKNRTVNGQEKVSLCDLGYCSVGIDEGKGVEWE
jgi:alpha-galactosidase